MHELGFVHVLPYVNFRAICNWWKLAGPIANGDKLVPVNFMVCSAAQSLRETMLPLSTRKARCFDCELACSCLRIVSPSTLAEATRVKKDLDFEIQVFEFLLGQL